MIKRAGGRYTIQMAILPPLDLVTTTTDGRGGILGSKSGHRVAGSSKVELRSNPFKDLVPSVPGCCIARKRLSPLG